MKIIIGPQVKLQQIPNCYLSDKYTYQLSPLVSHYQFFPLIKAKSDDIHGGKGLFTTWLHGLPLTPSVAQMFSCTAWTTVWKPVTLIISTVLITPRQRSCLKSRGRGPIDPNWKCHFTGLPSWRCSCSPGCVDVNSMFLLHFIVWYLSSSSTLPPSAWLGGCSAACTVLVSNQSARKLQQQSKIEVTAQEWTNWNRLLWNLQAFADTCWSQHGMSSLLPSQPSLHNSLDSSLWIGRMSRSFNFTAAFHHYMHQISLFMCKLYDSNNQFSIFEISKSWNLWLFIWILKRDINKWINK